MMGTGVHTTGCQARAPQCALTSPPTPAPTPQRGNTALHLAARGCKVQLGRALMGAPGCDVNARNAAEATPLHLAAAAGCMPLVSALLAAGAQVNAAAPKGTPLFAAIRTRQLPAVRALLAGGASVHAALPAPRAMRIPARQAPPEGEEDEEEEEAGEGADDVQEQVPRWTPMHEATQLCLTVHKRQPPDKPAAATPVLVAIVRALRTAEGAGAERPQGAGPEDPHALTAPFIRRGMRHATRCACAACEGRTWCSGGPGCNRCEVQHAMLGGPAHAAHEQVFSDEEGEDEEEEDEEMAANAVAIAEAMEEMEE
jgi:hypothetical protein